MLEWGSTVRDLTQALSEHDVLSALSCALELDGYDARASLCDVRSPWNLLRDVAYTQLSSSLLKKYNGGRRPSDEACSAAEGKFLHSNSLCAGWQYAPTNSWDEELMGETREQLARFWRARNLGPAIVDHWDQIVLRARSGPGSAVGAVGKDFYSKLFASRLTAPSTLVARLHSEDVSRNPNHVLAEESRAAQAGHGYTIRGSRLAFAPKNADVARCICVEPSLGIYYQLGFGALLERSLLQKTGIDLSKQPFKNRELARLGSISGHWATIDLESASDSMSLSMLRWALPRDWFYYLRELRSPYVEIRDREVELSMVSSMGNGFTFPLQTIFFSCIILAAARIRGYPLKHPYGDTLGNWGVFGDDLVVPNDLTPDVLRGLKLFGFRANDKKTFVEGPFRESCGSDFYRGQNVRGVYIKDVSSVQARAAVINQLVMFSTRTGFLVRHLVRLLRGTARFHYVPRWENDDAGLRVPLYRFPKPKRSKRYQSYLYRCWRPVPRFLWVYEDRVHAPPGHKQRVWNPVGMYLSFLRGTVYAMKIGVREDHVRYRTETGVAPYWDHTPDDPSVYSEGVDWQRWETVVYLLLM